MKTLCFFITAYVILVTLTGCAKTPEGVYVSEKNAKNYIELKKEGTFYAKERGQAVSGRYEVEEGAITLVLEGGRATRLRVQDDKLVDEDGVEYSLWTKGRTGIEYEDSLRARTERERPSRNRDAVINDLVNLGARAQQHYRRPISLGGGGNSFAGLTTDARGFRKLSSPPHNANGICKIAVAGNVTSVTLEGEGVEIGNDGKIKVKVQAYVTADNIEINILN